MRQQLNSLVSCQSELAHLVFGIGAVVELHNLDAFNFKFNIEFRIAMRSIGL